MPLIDLVTCQRLQDTQNTLMGGADLWLCLQGGLVGCYQGSQAFVAHWWRSLSSFRSVHPRSAGAGLVSTGASLSHTPSALGCRPTSHDTLSIPHARTPRCGLAHLVALVDPTAPGDRWHLFSQQMGQSGGVPAFRSWHPCTSARDSRAGPVYYSAGIARAIASVSLGSAHKRAPGARAASGSPER